MPQYTVRAGDAFQLGAALTLQQAIGQPLREFVAYDRGLIDAARAELLSVSSN